MGRLPFALETLACQVLKPGQRKTFREKSALWKGPPRQEDGLEPLETPLLRVDADSETFPTISGWPSPLRTALVLCSLVTRGKQPPV